MFKFLTKNSKWVFLIFGIIIGVVILGALCYMTQYTHIHVYYIKNSKGVVSFFSDTENAFGNTNQNLVNFFQYTEDTTFEKDFIANYANIVYDFQVAMSSFNDLIIIYGIISLICFAGLLILGNHNRRIYYKSNLYGGIALPLIPAIFSIVMIIKNTSLMGTFNKNKELFNRVSVIQDLDYLESENLNYSVDFLRERYSCDATTYILFDILFAIVLIYSLFLIVVSIKKYKLTAADRAKVLEKAVENND